MHNPNPIVSVTLGPPGLSLGDRKPFKLSQPEKKLLTQACPDIFRLRFARNPGEKVALKFYSSRLPKGTKITLPPVTSTENTGNEKRIIVLTKHNFFTVEITIEPGMWSGQRTVPVNAHISPQFVSKSKVLMFQISMVAKFARLTAGNYQTGELKDWARWMFGRLQSRFSDTISN